MGNVINKTNVIRACLFAAAVILIVLGIYNGGLKDTFNKAIHICYECIGIG